MQNKRHFRMTGHALVAQGIEQWFPVPRVGGSNPSKCVIFIGKKWIRMGDENGGKNMDGFREWISDNLRYIILGVSLVLVLALAVLGVRTITNIANGSSPVKTQTERETEEQTQANVIVETEMQSGNTAESLLTENDAKVLTMMTAYYTARTNKDIETLAQLDPSIDTAQEQANLDSSYVEGYSNIKTYSKAGPVKGSCVVYICYEGKVKDINTLVPSLTQFYLMSDEQGNYYIADPTGDAQAEQFIEEMRKSAEVQALIDKVGAECENAKNSDPLLKDFMDQYGNDSGDEEETEMQEEGTSTEGTLMVAIDGPCNVRAEGSTEADVVGTLNMGETVMKIGETEDGWSEIEFNGMTAYILSELLAVAEDETL